MLCQSFGVFRKMNDVESPDIGTEATLVAFDIEEHDKGDHACPEDYPFFLEVFEIGEEGFAF
ncbi:MAG TPA: hypothetical protein DCY32_04575 [Opitutae bacterium]|nr:hypothetical protein [Opitutae bacterium]